MKRVFALLAICIILFSSCNSEPEKFPLNEEKYGNPYGRDYICHVGDGKFSMMHIAGKDCLLVNEVDSFSSGVLDNVYKYKFDDDDLFVYAADGYAVVYAKSNLCKVFITDPPLEEVTGEDPKITGRSPENNYRIRELVGDEFKCIVYLDSFDEFTDYEQKILNDLKEKQDTEDEVHDALTVVLKPLGEVAGWYYQYGPYSFLYE